VATSDTAQLSAPTHSSRLPVHARPPDSLTLIPTSNVSTSNTAVIDSSLQSQSLTNRLAFTSRNTSGQSPHSPKQSHHGDAPTISQSKSLKSNETTFQDPVAHGTLTTITGRPVSPTVTPETHTQASIPRTSDHNPATTALLFLNTRIRPPDSDSSACHNPAPAIFPPVNDDSVCERYAISTEGREHHSFDMLTLISSSESERSDSDVSDSDCDVYMSSVMPKFCALQTLDSVSSTPPSNLHDDAAQHNSHHPSTLSGELASPTPNLDTPVRDAARFFNLCYEMDDVKSQFSDDPANFHPHAFTTDCLDEDATIPLAGPHEPSAYDNVSRWHTRVHSRPLKVEGLIATAPLEKGCDTKKFSPHDGHCDSDSDSEALTSDFSSLHLSSLAATQARTTFATYNCNGLANLVRKGFFRRFLAKHSPDILILTEVKMSLKRLFAFGALHILLRAFGYEFCYYNPQIRDTGGLHGTAIISKIKPQHVVCGYLDVDTTQVTPNSSPLPSPSVDPDDAKLSMDLDGRCITAVFEDFAVVNSYTPCSGFPKEGRTQLDLLAKDAFRRRYETALEQHCLNVKALYSKPVILSGDLNVTASRHDCFHRRNNPRFPGCKPWERDGFANICASLQLCDAYRELNPAYRSSDCTWWNTYYHWKHGKGLRLDYFLVPDTWRKEHLNRTAQEPTLLECYLDRNIRGSDHCPVFMSIAIPKSNTAEPSNLSALVPIHRDTKQYNFALVYEPRLHSDTRAPNASLTPGLPSRSAFLESDTMTALCAAVDCFSLATTENCDPHCPSPSMPVDGCPHNADAHYIPSFCSEREQAFDRWADSNEPPDCAPRMPAGCRHSSDAAAVTSVRRAHAVHASVPACCQCYGWPDKTD